MYVEGGREGGRDGGKEGGRERYSSLLPDTTSKDRARRREGERQR
jgi:hypothetical protein